jgi:hypothetical protein
MSSFLSAVLENKERDKFLTIFPEGSGPWKEYDDIRKEYSSLAKSLKS